MPRVDEKRYEEIFYRELARYRNANAERLEIVYSQDSNDMAFDYPDQNERNIRMVQKRRKELFGTKFGKVYHDQGRNISLLTHHIVDQHEQNYENINLFMERYLAMQIAEEHCTPRQEPAYHNIAFKDNVDVDRVMRKLETYIMDKTLRAQKHWYIVYKVFIEKEWLRSKKQGLFIEQMQLAFDNQLKCSAADFKKVESYFKEKSYTEWSLNDRTAPVCCKRYKEIAVVLDKEFQERSYAIPGTVINTKEIQRIR